MGPYTEPFSKPLKEHPQRNPFKKTLESWALGVEVEVGPFKGFSEGSHHM